MSVAGKISNVPQTLDKWVKAGIDSGRRAGVPAEVGYRVKALEREVRELRQASEI